MRKRVGLESAEIDAPPFGIGRGAVFGRHNDAAARGNERSFWQGDLPRRFCCAAQESVFFKQGNCLGNDAEDVALKSGIIRHVLFRNHDIASGMQAEALVAKLYQVVDGTGIRAVRAIG